jgi:23S rRNA pseudouridine1911/1915/1917 synthase
MNGGEIIELFQTEESATFKRLDLKLEVVFEDAYLAIIYKPGGILVSGNSFATIDNALSQNLKKSPEPDAVRPRPVHRLDYPTSGLLLIGKTTSSIISLNKLFEHHKVTKTYHAITIGSMIQKGVIDKKINNKIAFTAFEVLNTVESERFGCLNLVKLTPKNGRKHQLRKHLLANKSPILGDKEYFIQDLILKGKGLYLQASMLEFTHPFTNIKIRVSKELPKKFKKIFPEGSLHP